MTPQPRWRSSIDPAWAGLRAIRDGYIPRPFSAEGVRWPQRLGLGARRRWAETAAGRAQYIEVGSGPPVVLLHGLDGSSRWWAPTLAALAPRFRCLALEFVRFDRWRERARIPLAEASDFVAAWLAALGITQADLIGHSMGGYTASQIAIEQPALVRRLVLVTPAILPLPGGTLREFARFTPAVASLAPGFAPTFITDTLRTGPARLLRATLELIAARPLPLETIAAPTLLIWGRHDPLIPAADAPTAAARIPQSKLLVLDHARHVPMYEAPLACNTAIADFLAPPP